MSTFEAAKETWDGGKPLKGPVVEAYYAWRGLAVPKTENLRFYASLKHYKSGASYPAIIAKAENAAGAMTGIQRMWLAPDGAGKAAVPKGEQKMAFGVIKGSVVRLAEPIDGAPLLITRVRRRLARRACLQPASRTTTRTSSCSARTTGARTRRRSPKSRRT
jgi:hypothetical protein